MSKQPKNKGGRPKGSPNKATSAAREAIAVFVDSNAHRLQAWLDDIANGERLKPGDPDSIWLREPNPKLAFEMFQSVVEYHVPKLARTEHTGEGGGPLVIQAARDDETL